MAYCDHGYGRPSWRPRVSAPATYHSGTPRNQHPAVARWHAHPYGLATAIHEISGLKGAWLWPAIHLRSPSIGFKPCRSWRRGKKFDHAGACIRSYLANQCITRRCNWCLATCLLAHSVGQHRKELAGITSYSICGCFSGCNTSILWLALATVDSDTSFQSRVCTASARAAARLWCS